jgi:hypothetical protein
MNNQEVAVIVWDCRYALLLRSLLMCASLPSSEMFLVATIQTAYYTSTSSWILILMHFKLAVLKPVRLTLWSRILLKKLISSYLGIQEIPFLLWSVHYQVDQSMPLDSIVKQMNPALIFTPSFPKSQLNIVHPFIAGIAQSVQWWVKGWVARVHLSLQIYNEAKRFGKVYNI